MKFTHRRRIAGLALLVCVLGRTVEGGTISKTRAQSLNNLRTTDRRLIDLIDQGLARSSTLSDLVLQLESASVVAYLSRAALPPRLAGRTRLMGTGHAWRYLSVEIDEKISPLDVLTVLAHELQHALEIAGAESVIDEVSLRALYRRIGVDSGGGAGKAFETQDAVDMGRRVHQELMGWAW